MIIDCWRRLFSSVRAKLRGAPSLSRFSKLYDSGRFAEAYAAFRDVMEGGIKGLRSLFPGVTVATGLVFVARRGALSAG